MHIHIWYNPDLSKLGTTSCPCWKSRVSSSTQKVWNHSRCWSSWAKHTYNNGTFRFWLAVMNPSNKLPVFGIPSTMARPLVLGKSMPSLDAWQWCRGWILVKFIFEVTNGAVGQNKFPQWILILGCPLKKDVQSGAKPKSRGNCTQNDLTCTFLAKLGILLGAMCCWWLDTRQSIVTNKLHLNHVLGGELFRLFHCPPEFEQHWLLPCPLSLFPISPSQCWGHRANETTVQSHRAAITCILRTRGSTRFPDLNDSNGIKIVKYSKVNWEPNILRLNRC